MLAVCFLAGADAAHAQASAEYQVKAAFLLNFAQYVQWPDASSAGPETPIAIGILGEDPFGTILEQTFEGESINGRPLAVRRAAQVEELRNCHLLFISQSEKDRVTEIVENLKDAPVVTVGEVDGFAKRGGVINFYIEDGKVRFEINVGAAERKALKVSSQLLKRARIVG
jgi:hypothetical protein